MNKMIVLAGQAAGVMGLLVMAAAVLLRVSGQYVFGGFGTITLLVCGIGATGAGCFALLWVIASRDRN